MQISPFEIPPDADMKYMLVDHTAFVRDPLKNVKIDIGHEHFVNSTTTDHDETAFDAPFAVEFFSYQMKFLLIFGEND